MTIQVSILGLDRTGQSIGLALKSALQPIDRVGSDEDSLRERSAIQSGALDRAIHNLYDCVEKADIVVLNTPYSRSKELLEALRDVFKEGAVILYTGRMPLRVKEYASTVLPENRYLLGYYPGRDLNLAGYSEGTVAEANADLFRRSHVLIAAETNEPGDAVKLAADFSSIIGTVPVFTDPAEAQGLITLGVHFPKFLAALAGANITSQPGWEDARKFAGEDFLGLTSPLTTDVGDEDLAMELSEQRDNLILLLDSYLDQADKLRAEVCSGQYSSEKFEAAHKASAKWLSQRLSNNWTESTSPPLPTMGQWFGRLIGLGGRRRDEGKSRK